MHGTYDLTSKIASAVVEALSSGVVDRVEIRHYSKGGVSGAGVTGDMVDILGYPGLINFAEEKVARLPLRIDPPDFHHSLYHGLEVIVQDAVSLTWERAS